MSRRAGLGRNLNALLGTTTNIITKPSEGSNDSDLRYLPIEVMQRGKYQPRRDMDPEALQELADSIKTQGIIQPIVVRPLAANQYEIVAGERRWRAAQLAGLSEVPVIIKDIPDDKAIAVALIENIQREDLNPMEEARALQRLMQEFELTHQEVAETVGKKRTTVTNLLRLMSLEEDVKIMLEHGDVEMGHARALLALARPEQIQAARTVSAKGLSVRETEKLVRKLLSPTARPKTESIDPNIRQFQDHISDILAAKVTIQHGSAGKGKLIIEYNSVDELDGIVDHIK